jgi:hypothetical protein
MRFFGRTGRSMPAQAATRADVAGQFRPVGHVHGGDVVAGKGQAYGFLCHVRHAERARLAAERGQQGRAVEPALAGQAEAGGGDALGVDPGEAGGDLGGRQQRHVGALGALHRVVRLEDVQAGGGGHEQVAIVPQGERRLVAVHLQALGAGGEEFEAEAGHGDVERGGELLADRAGG